VQSLARIAREGLGSLPRASRLCRRSLAYGPTAPTTPYANSQRLPPVTSGARGPGDRGGSGTRLGRWRQWANQFPDPHATSSYVDFFYNGALIHRELYVTVDGGRVSLPLPERRGERLVTPIGYARLCRLLVSFETNANEFDRYIARAGIQVVDEPWP
jgi:hypothetical protein